MAEQIRSFWSHLCGIFGAIFGMIAGGTLVTIEQADAKIYGNPNCRYNSSYSKQTLNNGAVVYSCYGGGWFCGEAYTGYESNYKTVCAGHSPCYIMDVNTNNPRNYVYFLGCADGYYSTEGVGFRTSPTTSGVTSSTHINSVTSGWGVKMHQDISTLSGVTSVTGLDPARSYATGKCNYLKNASVSTSAGVVYVAASGVLPDGYDIDMHAVTNGKCAKCPSYGEYAANSANVTYGQNVSSCFMTSAMPRNDAADQVDGNATGTFVWTDKCFHDGDTTTYLAPACRNKVASGPCSISLVSYSDKSDATNWVAEACGGTLACKALAKSSVGTNNLPWKFKSSISCDAAKCYKEAAAADGVQFSYVDESAVSPGTDQNTIFYSVQRILYEDVLMDAEKDDVTMDSDLYADLGMSELDIELLVNAIEDEFDVNVPYTVYTKWQTVRDVVDWIEQNMALSM